MLWVWHCLFYHAELWELSNENMRNEMNMSACLYDWWKEMEMNTKRMCMWNETMIWKNEKWNGNECMALWLMKRNGNVCKSECALMAWE